MSFWGPTVLILWLHVLITVHEVGHAAMATALGDRVVSMRLGIGPGITVQLRRLAFPIRLGLIPIVGWVEYEQDPEDGTCGRLDRRVRTVLVAVAGPAVNLLVAFALAAAVGGAASAGWDVATAPGRTLTAAAVTSASTATRANTVEVADAKQGLGDVFEPSGPATIASTVPNPGNPHFEWRAFVLWLALISAVLGTMNLLPIPPLDGGVILCQFLPRLLGNALSIVGTVALASWTLAVLLADLT